MSMVFRARVRCEPFKRPDAAQTEASLVRLFVVILSPGPSDSLRFFRLAGLMYYYSDIPLK
eukprot:scaffold5291_cov86-Skeletonema_dohrnii-CCMP3373.AAC.1